MGMNTSYRVASTQARTPTRMLIHCGGFVHTHIRSHCSTFCRCGGPRNVLAVVNASLLIDGVIYGLHFKQ